MRSLIYILSALMFISSVAAASEDATQVIGDDETLESSYMEEEDFDLETDYDEFDQSNEDFYDESEEAELSTDSLQIGSSFDRKFLKAGEQKSLKQSLKRAALSTAEFGSGSAFYVGEFDGKHIMATNAHVLTAFANEDWTPERYNANPVEACKIFPGDPDSEPNYARFSLIQKEYDCKRLIGLWPEIDFALFEIEVLDDFEFDQMGISLKDSVDHFKGQELAMFSYGTFENPGMFEFDLAHTQDQLCRVFSEEVRGLSDENDETPVAVWSFATGCDISVGDSGSAMIDAATGLFTGIIWAGAADKSGEVSNDEYLESILKSEVQDDEMLWNHMNYGVPAEKISEVILASINSHKEENVSLLKKIFIKDLTQDKDDL